MTLSQVVRTIRRFRAAAAPCSLFGRFDGDTDLPSGCYPAPRMRELRLPGLRAPLYVPARRLPVAGLLLLTALVLVAVTGLGTRLGGAGYLLLAAVAGAAAVLFVPQPRPAFLPLQATTAGKVAAGSWVRHRGMARQVLNTHVRVPDVAGDPTPPVVMIRFSDATLWQFRPHDVLHEVQPVDTRWRPVDGVRMPLSAGDRRAGLSAPPTGEARSPSAERGSAPPGA